MGKVKDVGTGTFRRELFQFGLYKRNQGRIARQVTFSAVAIIIGLGVWQLQVMLANGEGFAWLLRQAGLARQQTSLAWAIPVGLFSLGIWLTYRMVNWPKFADFLIAVEAEMNKVYWPSRGVLFRSSMVVMFVIFFLGALLAIYDAIWIKIFDGIDDIFQ